MEANNKLKLFISYSHQDESLIDKFRNHISPLKQKGLLEDWYDRKIIPGQKLFDYIDRNLNTSDIICLFISDNFLSSDACLKEKDEAIGLQRKKGVVVVPIILSHCLWKEIEDLQSLLALPNDSQPISTFQYIDEAWLGVSKGIKDIIDEENKTRLLKLNDDFKDFLTNTELLTKTHPQKEKLLLDDIFVYPELEKYDELRDYDKKEDSKNIIENIYDYSKILIAGQNQSGKTTLCKKLFIQLRKINLLPVYIHDKQSTYKGKIENRIREAFKQQYQCKSIEEIDVKKIVPILDDFHLANSKSKHLNDLSKYNINIIIVDDILSVNIADETIISSFTHFRIKEFSPTLRNELYKKWALLSDDDLIVQTSEKYKKIDSTTELVDTTLGKIIGSGIMPAYPFFILSVISTHEAFQQPLNEQITSQGYCYQALIYLSLRKQGVKNEDIDTYINFLSELAYYFYNKNLNSITEEELNKFLKEYSQKFNLPVEQKILLNNLLRAAIILRDGFNNYSFQYKYLFYFFVARSLSEHIEENENEIKSIFSNLHKDENAYISVFLSHHSKDEFILDEIIVNAMSFFQEHNTANLSKDELNFFDKKLDFILQEVLPHPKSTPEQERKKRLASKDKQEERYQDDQNGVDEDKDNAEEFNKLTMELRKSLKTVEVMGLIIKNRAGSLKKPKLEFMFEEGMNTHLRLLTSFFELIKNEDNQKVITKFISERLNKLINDINEQRKKENKKLKEFSKEDLEKISKSIYWNINFKFINAVLSKIVHSLGSDKLTTITDNVCDKLNNPASHLIKHGIKMWYQKNLRIDEIEKLLNSDSLCPTTKKILKNMVVNHASMHPLKYKEKQLVETKLGIPSKTLLYAQEEKKEGL